MIIYVKFDIFWHNCALFLFLDFGWLVVWIYAGWINFRVFVFKIDK
ncbi:hypothetical protein l11_21870 [Neisseria weaveri LMG 5135]|nr:hypothetical protein l11_21870 [Neisseria weaveri LMG 5135]